MNLRHIWWRIAAIKTPGQAFDAVASELTPYFYRHFQRLNRGVFAIEIVNSNLGFFAVLNWALFVLHFCKKQGLVPYLEFTTKNYSDPVLGRDWFKYYFSNRAMSAAGFAAEYRPWLVTKVRRIRDLRMPGWCFHDLSLEQAGEIFREYIEFNPVISAEVEAFVAEHFAGKYVLGVHFRGTDKVVEAPQVAWAYCEQTIRNFLANHPSVDVLFVASDESRFIQYMLEKFPDIAVVSHQDHFRSDGIKAIHSLDGGGDNYSKGFDALVNSLLLSKCDALIRSSSFLSAWASIFNPKVPVVLLNKPLEDALWFPEVEIMKRSLDHYLPDFTE